MKKRILSVLALGAATLAGALTLTGCGEDEEELIGFDIELAKAVASELGVKVDFQLIKWESKEFELNGRSIDLIWNGLTINEERAANMEISTPYMNNKQVAVIRKADSGKFTSADSIVNASFVCEAGSAGQDVATANGYADVVALAGQVDALTEVKAGTSDIALLDSVLANFYCNGDSAYSDLTVIPSLDFSVEKYGIAARKGDLGTIDKINTALAALQASGELAKIADKYGLGSELCDVSYTSVWDSLTNEQKSGWQYIVDKGEFTVGYTLYAPIAYKE